MRGSWFDSSMHSASVRTSKTRDLARLIRSVQYATRESSLIREKVWLMPFVLPSPLYGGVELHGSQTFESKHDA